MTSKEGGAPSIMAAMAAPVAGPVVKPMCWLPKASHRPACRGAAPIIGRPSGSVGREPRQDIADGITEFGDAARQRNDLIELGERGRRIAAGQFDARGDADALLHRRHDEAAVDVIDRTPQRTCRVRLEFAVVATLEGERNAVAERPQNVSGPRSQRDHDMAREISPSASATRQRSPSGTIALTSDCLTSPPPRSEHPRIGLDHRAR